ncbi:MAG: tRNA (adenosine(37)-N6)-threonylcarbamoyltransferase complex transferase subunit TsaD [Candidatus Paceibacterota bacterium]
MILLSIETSCDETAISIVEIVGDFPKAKYEVLGNALFSQIDIHREYGGVFPTLAKREHIVTVVPMLEKALAEAKLESANFSPTLTNEEKDRLHTLLEREDGLADQLITFYEKVGRPGVNAIAVTSGPGLEPALWVGVNFAKALAYLWNVPVVPVDHMEGHILASVFDGHHLAPLAFPALALLVSGGHTELILMSDWNNYQKVGQTRDDAVGEAFDKVARLLGLPYPGGPEISKWAKEARERNLPTYTDLPHPMLKSGDLDFSFSGLKTAVRYAIAEKTLTDDEKKALARDFEDVVVKVLTEKVKSAIETYTAQSVILGGGVAANTTLRSALTSLTSPLLYPELKVYLPEINLSTDNSIMIALAGHSHLADALSPEVFANTVRANGNKSLSN